MDPRPFLVIGGGGHAVVVVDTLLALDATVEGVLDADPERHGANVLGVPVIGGDDLLDARDPDRVLLANAIGSERAGNTRKAVFERFTARGFAFPTLVHPEAVIAPAVTLGAGVQVMPRAVIRPNTRIGDNTLINTSASIDHDARIGAHVHIAPGVVFSGNVTVGDGCHIGVGAFVIQGIRIGEGVTVGAGAVVIRDVPAGVTVVGNPAKAPK